MRGRNWRGVVIGGAAALLLALTAGGSAQSPSVGSQVKSGTVPTAPSTPSMTAGKAAKPELIDINTASKEQLDALKGIGTKRADDIIKGRPYKGKDELYQKRIVPKAVYDAIRDQIIARQK